jgi:para-nitrobenzyl esterase
VGGIADFSVESPQNENCLSLNIWTPGLDGKGRPVMVWIHGGAFNMGSGSQPVFDGSKLAQRGDVVVVTLNYRLGLLGFLNLEAVTAGRIPATGNEGLVDQLAALTWLKANVSAFGGSPENITVFGESAGAMSIGCMMAMPKAKGLFHKAILQSGAASTAKPLASAVKVAEYFLELVGLDGSDAGALRALSVDQILGAQNKIALKFGLMSATVPVIDGEVIPDLPLNCIKAGSAAGIPVLVGTNLNEIKLFNLMAGSPQILDEATLMKRCGRIIPANNVGMLIDVYRKARLERGESVTPQEIWAAIQTDVGFRMPAIRLLEACCLNRQPAFNYLFTWSSSLLNGSLGACHALEVGFVFGNHTANFCGSGPQADLLSSAMQDAWAAFARNGYPVNNRLDPWQQYCQDRNTMILSGHSHLEPAPYDAERQVWDLIDSQR